MKKTLKDYEKIVGKKTIQEIKKQAQEVQGKKITHINSTKHGGGVAEILNSLVPLLNEVGIKTTWQTIQGNPEFFSFTKSMHNASHGEPIRITEKNKKLHHLVNKKNAEKIRTKNMDLVVLHDPQPMPLIEYCEKKQPWIWRFHLQDTHMAPQLLAYLKEMIKPYDAVIVTQKNYLKTINKPRHTITPTIDPFTNKNKPLTKEEVEKKLLKENIPLENPIIAQISRFDKWKDFPGVIRVFKKVDKKTDATLVLLGNYADDDPEGTQIFSTIKKICQKTKNTVLINKQDDTLVNALQTRAAVVIQKSIQEGFGLTVTEALWKKTPVVASRVGGIPLQVIDKKTGYLISPRDEESFAEKTTRLLEDTRLRKQMGKNAHQHVKKNFLTTTHLTNYLRVIKKHCA